MSQLKIGSKVPAMKLQDQSGKARPLAATSTDYTVLYFYPKDDTPGCTLEAQEFTRHIAKFKKLGTEVIGISGGTTVSKQKFCEKYALGVTLLSDTDFSVAKKFGAYGEKKFMGKSFMGILRKTFVLDKAGKIVQVYPEVKPDGHAEEVLKYLSGGAKSSGMKKSQPVSAKVAKSVKKSTTRKVVRASNVKRSKKR